MVIQIEKHRKSFRYNDRNWESMTLSFDLPSRNRALLQRCKRDDAESPHDFPGMRMNNGWREWDNLDALFESMGPNPLVMSEDLGPQVARGYQHSSNIATSLCNVQHIFFLGSSDVSVMFRNYMELLCILHSQKSSVFCSNCSVRPEMLQSFCQQLSRLQIKCSI